MRTDPHDGGIEPSVDKRDFRFSVSELLVATTALCLIACGFAVWGVFGASATALLAGILAYAIGRPTGRPWLTNVGSWTAVVTGCIAAAFLAADFGSTRQPSLGWMRPYIGNPTAILVTGVILLAIAGYFRLLGARNNLALIASANAWFTYAAWEFYCVQKKYDIRVDLLLIAPLLFFITLWGVISAVSGIARLWLTTKPKPSRD
jgi:hypothetical protein